MKTVLSIAGSDCSGGAGIQADLKTYAAYGVFGMSVIVSVVAENTCRVIDMEHISDEMIRKQIDAVWEDMGADGVKIGMLPEIYVMEAVAEKLRQYRPANVVIDPVMYAKNGCALMEKSAVDTLIETVVPLADVLTPNIPEAERITGMTIRTAGDMEEAARRIQGMGCRAAVVKGGHREGTALDILCDGTRTWLFDGDRIDSKHTHGTGCTFSSAIAAGLALGMPLPEAVGQAKRYVTEAIRHAPALGRGYGPTNHFYFMETCAL